MDTDSNAKYASFYFAEDASEVGIILAVLTKLEHVIESDREVEIKSRYTPSPILALL